MLHLFGEREFPVSVEQVGGDEIPCKRPIGQPGPDAPVQAYLSWAEELAALLETEISTLTTAGDRIETRLEALTIEYETVYDQSSGLSASLEIQEIQHYQAKPVRTNSQIALIGGLIAVCAWLVNILYTLSRSGIRSDASQN